MTILALVLACKHRDYATSEGTASVVLTPIGGEGYTIDADGLTAYGTDNWDLAEGAYTQRVVDIQGSIPVPGPCFEGGEAVSLEVDLNGVPYVFFKIVPNGAESALGTADETSDPIAVDAWSGEYVGEVEFFYGPDSPCALPATRHSLEVRWTLDEGSWSEVKRGVGDIWPPVPLGI
jgi:hypothetical protein